MLPKYWGESVYRAKTLFTGYKLGFQSKDLFVGVPDKYLDKNGEVVVQYADRNRLFQEKDIVDSREFPDKFSEGTYTLHYYLWRRR